MRRWFAYLIGSLSVAGCGWHSEYPLVDPERFFAIGGERPGRIVLLSSAEYDSLGYGRFSNGVKHAGAIWAPRVPPQAISVGQIEDIEIVLYVRVIPPGMDVQKYFDGRVADDMRFDQSLRSVSNLPGIKADRWALHYSSRFPGYSFVARYRNYVILYNLAAKTGYRWADESAALENIRAVDLGVYDVLQNAR